MNNLSQRNLEVVLKFILDRKTVEDLKSGTKNVDKVLDDINQKLLLQTKIHQTVKESLDGIQRNAQKALVASSGFLATAFIYSQKYVSTLKETDPLFRKWNAATKDIQKSHERIGKVVATEMLPLYRQAAGIVRNVANFVESNPEVVKAALNTAVFVAGFSALTIAVTKGIKFVADVTYITTTATQLLAAKTMNDAANKQLAASAGMQLQSGGQIAQDLRKTFGYGGATALSPIASAGLIITGLIASGFVAYLVDNMISKTKLGNKIQEAQKEIVSTSRRPYPGVINPAMRDKIEGIEQNPLQKITEKIKQFFKELDNASLAVDRATSRLRGSEFENEIVNAYMDMREKEKEVAIKYNEEVKRIHEEYGRSIANTVRNYLNSVGRIETNYKKEISTLTSNYIRESKKSEMEYAKERANIIRDAGIEIQRIEEDLQDRLLKMREEHEFEVEDLVARRDALGLVKQIRDYNRKRAEEIANTNKEIARRRQDLALRLRDLAENYMMERKQRAEEFAIQLKEAKANRDEQLKQLQESYQEELRQLAEAKRTQLQQLKQAYDTEQQHIRQAFIAQVRDLDAALLGEQRKKQQYYQLMLADAERFLAQYRSTLPGGGFGGTLGGGTGRRQQGGYATRGIYALAEDNKREYVMSNPITKMAESLIGGTITNEKLMGLFSGKQVIYNDYRRIDSRITAEDRRVLTNDILEKIAGAI